MLPGGILFIPQICNAGCVLVDLSPERPFGHLHCGWGHVPRMAVRNPGRLVCCQRLPVFSAS